MFKMLGSQILYTFMRNYNVSEPNYSDLSKSQNKRLLCEFYEKSFDLPDGQRITLGDERFRCPEAMFNPALLGKNDEGIHDILSTCIKNVDMSMRRQMYSNILISGGVGELDGFEERLSIEMTRSSPERAPVNIETSSKPEISSWLGATILGEAPGSKDIMVSRAEYEEEGFRAVQRKCFS